MTCCLSFSLSPVKPEIKIVDNFVEDKTGKPVQPKSQVAVRLPRNLFNKFRRYVQETGMSQTDVVVTALAQYLDSDESVPLIQKLSELEKRVSALEEKG